MGKVPARLAGTIGHRRADTGGHYRVGLIRGYTKDERARNEFLMVSLSLRGNQRVEKTSAPPSIYVCQDCTAPAAQLETGDRP